jgi:hypothetical protein
MRQYHCVVYKLSRLLWETVSYSSQKTNLLRYLIFYIFNVRVELEDVVYFDTQVFVSWKTSGLPLTVTTLLGWDMRSCCCLLLDVVISIHWNCSGCVFNLLPWQYFNKLWRSSFSCLHINGRSLPTMYKSVCRQRKDLACSISQLTLYHLCRQWKKKRGSQDWSLRYAASLITI